AHRLSSAVERSAAVAPGALHGALPDRRAPALNAPQRIRGTPCGVPRFHTTATRRLLNDGHRAGDRLLPGDHAGEVHPVRIALRVPRDPVLAAGLERLLQRGHAAAGEIEDRDVHRTVGADAVADFDLATAHLLVGDDPGVGAVSALTRVLGEERRALRRIEV